MFTYLPKQIALRAFLIYLATLIAVSVLFADHMMSPLYLVMGVMWVGGFMLMANQFTVRWGEMPSRNFMWVTFWVAVALRVVWVAFSYFYFLYKTGMPFEFDTADALAYHLDSEWLASESLGVTFKYLFQMGIPFSDTGYFLLLSLFYRLVGPNIFLARIVKCLLSAWTCLLVYKLARRNFGEATGRMSAIFCCLMPNLIYYCGVHLKETEMIFLTFATLECIDHIIHEGKVRGWYLALTSALALSLFMFRTVMGLSLLFAKATSVVFTASNLVDRWRRVMLVGWVGLTIAIFLGGTVSMEVQNTWENRANNQMMKRTQQTLQGNQWAKYATGTVMAPMMFVIPFPTMIDVDQQYSQQMLNGGNYLRNFFGVFVIIAMVSLVFVKRTWREHLMLLGFLVAYLGVVALSGFANSERFVLPALPGLLILAAYGLTELDEYYYRWVRVWYWVLPVMAIGWAFFKLGSRGIV